MLGIGGEGAAEWLQLPGEVLAGLVGLVLKHRTAEVPVELDVEQPKFRAGLERLRRLGAASDAAKKRGGIIGKLKGVGFAVAAAATFARLYVLPTKRNEIPPKVLMVPSW